MADRTLTTDRTDDSDESRTGELVFFAASGLSLIVVLVMAVVDATSGEWRAYQETYRKLVAEFVKDPAQRKVALEMETGYKQLYLPSLHRIDRCTTCHLGIENPAMANAPQPFRLHPGDTLKHHRPERFGCAVCHQGQGLATNAKEAHGRVEHWPRPMLDPPFIEAACGRCHDGYDVLRGAPVLTLGRKILREQGCVGCHRIRKRGGNIGPELTGVAQKDVNRDGKLNHEDWEWHFRHFKKPAAVSPGSAMPSLGLSDKEAKALVTLVLSFSSEQIHLDYLVPAAPDRIPSTPVARGKLVFEQAGCAGCHGKDGAGERSNLNAQSGGLVPGLTKVKQGYSEKEIMEVLEVGRKTPKKDEAGPKPPLDMPGWKNKLSKSELKDLIQYLFSLAPEEKAEEKTEEKWDD